MSDELEQMSDEELVLEEDRLLLENELNPFRRNRRFAAGRFMLGILILPFWGLALGLMAYIQKTWDPWILRSGNPLLIPAYLSCLGAGIFGAHLLWRSVGPHGRSRIRLLLRYWPVTLYLFVLIASYFKAK